MGIFTKIGRPFRDEMTSLEKIGKWFFAPLMVYRPEGMSQEAFLEHLFHIKERSIAKYKVNTGFSIPGLYVETGNSKIQGLGYRKVHRGAVLLIRHDMLIPEVYDVSFLGGPGRKEQVFCLNRKEWDSIKPHITVVENDDDQAIP